MNKQLYRILLGTGVIGTVILGVIFIMSPAILATQLNNNLWFLVYVPLAIAFFWLMGFCYEESP